MEVVLRLVRKYTFIEAELDEGLQEYRPPFGPKTEVQCYVNDYTPQSIMPRAEPPLKLITVLVTWTPFVITLRILG